jgi:hypothetical protein
MVERKDVSAFGEFNDDRVVSSVRGVEFAQL